MFHSTAQLLIKGEVFTGNVVPPKHITNMLHWYKQCRKAIPQVPELFSDTPLVVATCTQPQEYWFWSSDPIVTADWIKFELQSTRANKAQLVIKRR